MTIMVIHIFFYFLIFLSLKACITVQNLDFNNGDLSICLIREQNQVMRDERLVRNPEKEERNGSKSMEDVL
jgi:hypothetical protein